MSAAVAVAVPPLHDDLVVTCRAWRAAAHRAAVLLARAHDEALHRALGFANLLDYAEQALELTRRQARDLLGIGRRLAELPELDDAFGAGLLDWTKARELVRVVVPATAAAWVARAQQTTSRELERLVALVGRGDPPPDLVPEDVPSARTRFVTDIDRVDLDVLKAALTHLRATAGVGADVDDGALLALMAQRVLHDEQGGVAPVSAERYRIVLRHCPDCGVTDADPADVDETHVGQALCDAECVDLRPGEDHGHVARRVPPATRRAVLERDGHHCAVPGCTNTVWLDVHHLWRRSDGGGHGPDNLATLCAVHHRLIHAGVLRFERVGHDWVAEAADGRVRLAPIGWRRTRTGAPPLPAD